MRDDKTMVESYGYLHIDDIRKQDLQLSELKEQYSLRGALLKLLVGQFYPSVLQREMEMINVLMFIKSKEIPNEPATP